MSAVKPLQTEQTGLERASDNNRDAEQQQLHRRAMFLWFYGSLFGLLLGPFIGSLQSFQFITPSAMDGLANVALAYSKLRVMHTHLVVYSWLVMAFVALSLWIVPRLSGRPLMHPKWAITAAWLWMAGLAVDVILIWAAIPGSWLFSLQPYEYAETPIAADLLLGAGLVIVGWILTQTVRKRRVEGLYVSLWYLLAAYWGTTFAFVVINFVTPAFLGLGNVMFHAWWIHNAVGLIITPFGVGVGYYVIPIITGKPIYSHRLGLLGFWTLYAFYPGIGLHHFLQMPMPLWLNQFSVISSVLLVIPVIAVVFNQMSSIRAARNRLLDSYALRFIYLGALFYLLTGLQGAFQSNNVVNPFIHFTEWVQAHAHMALAAGFTSYAIGGLIYLYPRLTGRQLYHRQFIRLSFWSMVWVFPLFFAFFTLSGLIAGTEINLLGISVYEAIPTQVLARVGRSVTGIALMLSWWLFAYVLIRSLKRGAPFREGMDEVAPMPGEEPLTTPMPVATMSSEGRQGHATT